jgi:hypothetical protein
MQINFVKDALYNCHPQSASREYAKGVLVGLVSGLMASGLTFENSISEMRNAVRGGIFDLEEAHVVECLPPSWFDVWNA